MQITFNIIVALLVMVIAQSIFASGLLYFSKANRFSNRLLSILIFAIALWLVDDFMRTAKIYRLKPDLYFMPIFYSLSFGPLIYFYVKSLVNEDFRFKRIHLLHFIPVALQAALYFWLSSESYAFKKWYWENVHRNITYRLEFDGTWVSMSTYLILSFQLLRHYQVWVEENFSEVSKIRLNWLRIILSALLILCIQWLVEIILRDFGGLYFEYNYSVEILGVLALILGISGLKQSNLSGIHYDSPAKKDVQQIKALFIPDNAIMAKIREGMERQQLYLNPTLTLVEFSQALKLNTKIVSRHINSGFQQSFNDFVNTYRVDEVKRRLTSENLERLTIMGIALDSGFNSKTTFNRIFKEFTGVSPSDFTQ